MLSSARSARLEAWAASPSFETHRFAMLLRMRSGRVARSTMRLLLECLVEPARDHRGDLLVVLLQHQDMAVALDAEIGEPDEARLHARLLQKLYRAVVVGRVIRGLRRQHQDRHLQ